MKDGLYHRNLYWHSEFDFFFENNQIQKTNFSKHVQNNQYTEGKRVYDLKDITLDFLKQGIIIEVEVLEGKIKKLLIRNKYKEGSDICTALAIEDNELVCKTCYLNRQSDNHDTLNPNKYVIEDEKPKYSTGTTATIAELIKYKNEQNKKR